MYKPNTLQTEVLERFMKEPSLKSFLSDYRDNLYRHKQVSEPNEKDIKIANIFRQNHSYSKTAKLLGLQPFQVRASIGRVFAHKK